MRSQIFIPANNERMIRKGESIPADSIVFDLEDSVPDGEKDRARSLLEEIVPTLSLKDKVVCVRINSKGTSFYRDDLNFLKRASWFECVLLPKADAVYVDEVRKEVELSIEPLIETATGLVRAGEIASREGVLALSYGAADLALSLGGSVDTYINSDFVMVWIVANARANGVIPIDCVFFDVRDREGYRRTCQRARNYGFTGKHAIHPSQVEVANEVFSPSQEELRWAEEVVKAYEEAVSSGRGAISLRGKLIDAVHYRIAKEVMREKSLMDNPSSK